jgi:hypothetical protein
VINIKKIVVTIKDNGKDSGTCNVNLKMEKNDKATESENLTASNVYNAIAAALEELKKQK